MRAFFAALAIGCSTAAAAATNLLPNGNFDSAQDPALLESGGGCGGCISSGWWTLQAEAYGAGWIGWQPADDANGAADSGALAFSTDADGDPATARSECFAVPAGGAASVGGKYRITADAGGAQSATAPFVFTFACTVHSAGCGSPAVATLAPQTGFSGTWAAMTPAEITLPAAARSADCALYLAGVQAAAVEVDDLFFTADFIQHDGFEP